jgi:hypothetical protein
MRIPPGFVPSEGPPERQPEGQPQHTPIRRGHAHFWQRALSRRQVIVAGAAGSAAAATLLSARFWVPELARAAPPIPADPKPIPLTLGPFHVQLIGPGHEPSTITDFNGFVGVADVQGTGTGIGGPHPSGTLLFDTDMRFMSGEYIGVDGKHYHSTFGFV